MPLSNCSVSTTVYTCLSLARSLKHRTAAAAEALKKWDGGRSLIKGEESGKACLTPPKFSESGCYPQKFFENIGANLCSLVHFGDIGSSKVGRKIGLDAFPSHF